MYRLLNGKTFRIPGYPIVTNVVLGTHQSFGKLWRFYHIHLRIRPDLPTASYSFRARRMTSRRREEIGEEAAGR